MQDEIRELMYASFDREMTREEQARLDEALQGSEALRKEQQELQGLRKQTAAAGEVSFEPFFAERVMERIAFLEKEVPGLAGLFNSLQFAFKRVAVGAVLAALVLLFLNIRTIETQQTQQTQISAADLEESLEEVFEQISWQMLEEEL